jgi:formylglycine-generating enzyme required for sulfatase activity
MSVTREDLVNISRYSLLLVSLIIILIGSRSCLDDPSLKIQSERAAEEISRLAVKGDPRLPEILDEKMVLIPSGSFIMGCDDCRQDESPEHSVYLDAFEIDQFEVTNIQYRRFIIEKGIIPPRYWVGQDYPEGQDIFPVVGVRWKDAEAYCAWNGKRLPTEAEWEKACRGVNGSIYPWGNLPQPEFGNVGILPGGPKPEMWEEAWSFLVVFSNPEDFPTPKPIGSYPAGTSPYGLLDLVGNASEWTADRYNWDGYGQLSAVNPLVLEPTWNHVLRGSAWLMPFGTTLDGYDYSRCSARSSSHGDTRDARMGFRCARSLPSP